MEFGRVEMKRHLCPMLLSLVKPKVFPPSPVVISAPYKDPCTCSSFTHLPGLCKEEKAVPVLCFSFPGFKLWHYSHSCN